MCRHAHVPGLAALICQRTVERHVARFADSRKSHRDAGTTFKGRVDFGNHPDKPLAKETRLMLDNVVSALRLWLLRRITVNALACHRRIFCIQFA